MSFIWQNDIIIRNMDIRMHRCHQELPIRDEYYALTPGKFGKRVRS
jgi:hypothetical protein